MSFQIAFNRNRPPTLIGFVHFACAAVVAFSWMGLWMRTVQYAFLVRKYGLERVNHDGIAAVSFKFSGLRVSNGDVFSGLEIRALYVFQELVMAVTTLLVAIGTVKLLLWATRRYAPWAYSSDVAKAIDGVGKG